MMKNQTIVIIKISSGIYNLTWKRVLGGVLNPMRNKESIDLKKCGTVAHVGQVSFTVGNIWAILKII